jgi:hypothetical protein
MELRDPMDVLGFRLHFRRPGWEAAGPGRVLLGGHLCPLIPSFIHASFTSPT